MESRTAHEGERRQVTVLFADLRGSLAVLADVDPEDSQALLDAVLTAMTDAVHRYEGAVNQVMGDGIMALFGAPIAHEDHALRAACAALAMQDAVQALRDPTWEARGVRPQIRVGLHSGDVAIRSVRNDLSMDYRAVGPTTHIAARMEQLAAPGTVWLTEDTYKLGQGRLYTRRIGPKVLKGIAVPVQVHELKGISARTRFQANALRGLSELVGRADTLEKLELAASAAREGERRTAVLYGEPGVGKSRLCYELLQRAAAGVRVLEASSFSYFSERPHGLLASMLRAVIGIDDNDDLERIRTKAQECLSDLGAHYESKLPVALELLDVVSDDLTWSSLDPSLKRRRIFEFLRELLEAWCERGPSVILCEDLHWCDSESLEFICGLVDKPPGARTLLLLTHRPELDPPWRAGEDVFTCHVPPLDPESAELLLCSLLGPAVSLAPLRSWLTLRTDGNPFFIEESARALLETGMMNDAKLRTPMDRADVPASVDALLSARIDRLPEPALEVLQAAAVLDEHAAVDTLRAVVQLDPVEFRHRIAQLTRAELLYEATSLSETEDPQPSHATIRFKHALIQEVVYKHLVRPRRRALHVRVVEVMVRQLGERLIEHVDRLAEHAYRAELWEPCAEYQKLAGVRAASRGASSLAVAHLERGLDALQHLPHNAEHTRAAIDMRLTALAALLPLGAHERAIQLLHEAARMAEQLHDVGRLARVSSQLSAQLWYTARYDEARAHAEKSLSLVQQLDGDQFALESAAHYNIMMVQHAHADYEATQRSLDALLVRCSGAAERRRLGWVGYPSVLIRTFIIAVSNMTGSFGVAARVFEEGRALADQLGHAFSRTMIVDQYAMCLLIQAEVQRAADLLQACLDLCRKEEIHSMYAASAIHMAIAQLELGAVEKARALLESVDALALARAGHYATDYKLIALSELERRSGQREKAREIAERAVQETLSAGERGFHVCALIQLGDVLCGDATNHAAALSVYRRALDEGRSLRMRPFNALAMQGMARAHAASGDAHQAHLALEGTENIWTELDAPARIEQVRALRRQLLQSH